MKAHITEGGTLVVVPENTTEAYALGLWEGKNRFNRENLALMETHAIRGSSLRIDPLDAGATLKGN